MYDPVTSRELEDNYQKYVQKLSKTSENDELNLNNSEFTISIMGREYQIDFQNMEQIGYENTRTIRRGKDDAISCIKGIAGLKISS